MKKKWHLMIVVLKSSQKSNEAPSCPNYLTNGVFRVWEEISQSIDIKQNSDTFKFEKKQTRSWIIFVLMGIE